MEGRPQPLNEGQFLPNFLSRFLSPVSVPSFCPHPWFLSLIYRPLGGGNDGISNQQQPPHQVPPGPWALNVPTRKGF